MMLRDKYLFQWYINDMQYLSVNEVKLIDILFQIYDGISRSLS